MTTREKIADFIIRSTSRIIFLDLDKDHNRKMNLEFEMKDSWYKLAKIIGKKKPEQIITDAWCECMKRRWVQTISCEK